MFEKLKRLGIIGLSVATVVSAAPVHAVYADVQYNSSENPIKDNAGTAAGADLPSVRVNIPKVEADTIPSGAIEAEDREETYTGVTHKFVEDGYKASYTPDTGSKIGRQYDLSKANFTWYFKTGDKDALNSIQNTPQNHTDATANGWGTDIPTATHVSDSTYVRILIIDTNGVFTPVMSTRAYKFAITPIELSLELDNVTKNWGEDDPDFNSDDFKHDYLTIDDSEVLPGDVFTYTLGRVADDASNSAANREKEGDHPIFAKAEFTSSTNGSEATDYKITNDTAMLKIQPLRINGIPTRDVESPYDKEAHGYDDDDIELPSAQYSYRVEIKDATDADYHAVASLEAAKVTDANVNTKTSGTGRLVKIIVTSPTGQEISYGPFAIKVWKLPVEISVKNGILVWDRSEEDTKDPTADIIEHDAEDYLDIPEDGGNSSNKKALADGDHFVYTGAVIFKAGNYETGKTYNNVIDFDLDKCAVYEGSRDNSGNYIITKAAGKYNPTDKRTQEITKTFTVTGFTGEYDGKDHFVTAKGFNYNGDEADLTYQISTDGGKTWSTPVAFDNNSVSERDVCNIKVKVAASFGGAGGVVEREANLIITKRKSSIIAQPASKKKGQTDPTFTVVLNHFGIAGEEPEKDIDYTVARDKTSDSDPEKVGVHSKVIKVNFKTKNENKWSNYDISTQDADFTITDPNTEKLSSITITGYKGVYDGHEHSVTYSEIPKGTKVTYSLDGGNTWVDTKPMFKDTTLAADGVNTAAQSVKVKFTLDGESVIKDSSVLITRKTAYIRVNSATKQEGDPDPEWTAAVSGVINDETFDYSISRTDAGDETVGTHKGVLVPTLNAEYPNYSIHLVSNALTITKGAAYSEVQKFAAKGWSGTYDGTGHTVTITTAVPGSEVTYATEEGGTYTSTKPSIKHVKDSTNVYIKCTKGKYEKIIKTEITVKKRNASITVNNASKVQGEPMPEFSAYTDNLAKKDKIDYNLSCTVSDTVGAHSGAIKCTVSGEYPDYVITVRNGTLTITKKATENELPKSDPNNPENPTDAKQRKGETSTGDDSKDGKTTKDKITKGEVTKGREDNLELIDRNKYIVDSPETKMIENKARFAGPEDGLEMVVFEGEPKSISRNGLSEDGVADPAKNKRKAGNAVPYIVGALVAGSIAVGLGVTGAWSILWLLLLGLLFKKKRKHWNGLLTYENNMFIKVKGDATGVEDMQDIINKGVSVEELQALMGSSNVETILPAKTQMSIDIDGEGEQTFEADEAKFYEVLGADTAKGKHAIVNIFNTFGKFSMTVEMDVK